MGSTTTREVVAGSCSFIYAPAHKHKALHVPRAHFVRSDSWYSAELTLVSGWVTELKACLDDIGIHSHGCLLQKAYWKWTVHANELFSAVPEGNFKSDLSVLYISEIEQIAHVLTSSAQLPLAIGFLIHIS